MTQRRRNHEQPPRLGNVLSRIAGDRRGVTIVFTGIAFTAILGFAALGTEIGNWYLTKRAMQGAADAAAFSAARAASGVSASSAMTDAKEEGVAVAATAGWVTGQNNVTVTVGAPTSGAYLGLQNAYEVKISQPQTPLFSKILTAAKVTRTITARAVATAGPPGKDCVVALNQAAVTGVKINAYANVSLSSCDLQSDAAGTSSMLVSGNASLTADSVLLSGVAAPSTGTVTTTSGVQSNQDPVSDPDSYIPSAKANMPVTVSNSLKNVTTPTILPPGTYVGGIKVTATTLTLQAGTYVMNDGDFATIGAATVNATAGTTIVLTSTTGTHYGTVSVTGAGTINLTAPTDLNNPYHGVAIAGDSASPTTAGVNIVGGTHINVTGDIYFPKQPVTFLGQGTSACTRLIAYQVTFSGGATFSGNCSSIPGMSSIGQGQTKLVE